MTPLALQWQRCLDNVWCSFENLDLAHEALRGVEGVYVIWHLAVPGQKDAAGRVVRAAVPAQVVRVGQGAITTRIAEHRKNPEITKYAPYGMRVTWATVPAPQRGGVERFLSEHYKPLVGDRFPDVPPIPVNLP